MNKQMILDEIRRMAVENGGTAPGQATFESATGIGKSTWFPVYWLRWGDALREAGYQGNLFKTRFDSEFLIRKYIELIRELRHFPIDGELVFKRKKDKKFPSPGALGKMGGKFERIEKILQFCQTHQEFNDVIPLLPDIIVNQPTNSDDLTLENSSIGYVYLLRHGSRREYKIGRTYNPVRREGEFRTEFPEKLEPVHQIKTDDPVGIEKYWHKRFAEKRKNGEWFALTTEDIRAFKKWKRIY